MCEILSQEFKPFPTCPLCGTELENVFLDDENSLVLKTDEGLEEIFLCDEGVFRFIPDNEHPELLHIEWHHQH